MFYSVPMPMYMMFNVPSLSLMTTTEKSLSKSEEEKKNPINNIKLRKSLILLTLQKTHRTISIRVTLFSIWFVEF